MIVHVTNHCNFRCDHCFIDFSPKRDLKLDQYQKLAKEVGKLFWLDIGGGEPFLRKDLVDIIEAFDAKVIQIPTNASLQDHIVNAVKEMKNRIRGEISLSLDIDGFREYHDKVRGTPGNYDQVWDTFEKLRSIGGVRIKINTVVTKNNYKELIEIMHYVRSNNPDFHSIILLRGDPINPTEGLPLFEELTQLGPQIFDILQTYDYGKDSLSVWILKNYHRYMWNTSMRTLKEQTQVIPCLAGQAHKIVMGNGDVSSCEMLKPVGNLNDKSWSQIMQSKKFLEQKQYIKEKKCYCTHNCAMLDSILFSFKSIPHLIHENIQTEF